MRMPVLAATWLCCGALVGTLAAAVPDPDAAADYVRNCAMCHGRGGAGDGPVSASLSVKPPDLTQATWQSSRTDEDIARAIRDGARAMPAFRERMTAEQITALTAFVRGLAPDADGQ